MFFWKNAVVLIGLLCIACAPFVALAQNDRERAYLIRLLFAGAAVNIIAMSFVPTAASQALYALLLLPCFSRAVPMVGTYIFFLVWAPSASRHMNVGAAYLLPLRPMMIFSLALLAAYMLNPRAHLRRGFDLSDFWLLMFLLMFSLCASARLSLTETMRNFGIHFFPYALTYQIISRLRITRPELALRYIAFAGVATGLVCLFEFLRYWPLYAGMEYLKGDGLLLDVPQQFLLRGGLYRAYGPYSHPLVGSTILGMLGIAMYGLAVLRGWKAPVVVAALLLLLGLFATVSRSGAVVLDIGLFTMLVLQRRRGPATALALVSAIGLVAMIMLSRADLQANASYRLDLFGIPLAMGSRVWLGYPEALTNGMLNKFVQGQGFVDLVNIYVSIIVRGGVISLIPYLAFLATSFGQYRKLVRAGPTPDQRVLGQVCLSAQVGFIAAGSFVGAWNAAMLLSFVMLAILVVLRHEARLAPREALRRHEPPLGGLLLAAEPLPMLR